MRIEIDRRCRVRIEHAVGLLTAWLALGFAGCSSVEVPEMCHYRLARPVVTPAAPTGEVELVARSEPRLAIGELQLAAELASDRLGITIGPVQMRFHKFHGWAASLDSLLAEALLRGLQTSGRFAEVFDGPSRHLAELTLDGRVHDFSIEVGPDGWYGRAHLELAVRDTQSGQLVVRCDLTSVRRASAANAEAGVLALSDATADVIEQFVAAWDRCSAARSAAAPR